MRDLSDTLKNAQQAMTIDALVKIVLTHGESSYTYERDRILSKHHPEGPWSQTARIVLHNRDSALTALDFKGFKGVISDGAIGDAGEEYSACAPLWVVAQKFGSYQGELECTLSLIGIPDLLAEDKASRNYNPDKDDTKTIETLLIEVLEASLGCFSHCKAYEVVIDSRDSLINTYKPKDGFRVYKGSSRLNIAKRLLDCTECVMLAKADEKLHIFLPQITGTPVYSYSLEAGHSFFASAHRKALIIPNYIYVSSSPPTVPNWVTVTSDPYSGEAKDQTDIDKFGARRHTTDFGAGNLASDAECEEYADLELDRYIALHDPYYEGIAIDQVSIDAIGEIRAYRQGSFEDDDQAQQVAEAILAKYKLNAEMGAASVPNNVGQEVYDYINVVDSRQGDERAGNIGRLTRHYDALKAEWPMSFNFGQRPEAAVDIMPIVEEATPYFGQLIVDNLYAQNILADSLDFSWLDPATCNIDLSKIGDNLDNLPDGEFYARVKKLHLDAEGGLKMDENIVFDEGFDPRTKETAIHRGTTPPEDLTKLWIDTTTDLNVVKRYNGVTAQWERASPANLDQLENGIDYARVKKMALNTDGLVLIDQIYTVGGTFGLVKSAVLTADGLILMDELVDGEYGRVKSAGLSAAGLVLLDRVVEGDYGLVYTADISAHHIMLSSVLDGGGYKKYTDTEYLKLIDIEEEADVTAGQSLSILTDRTLAFIADTTTRKTVSADEKTGAGEAHDIFISKLTAYGLSLKTANSSTRVELTVNGLKGYSGGTLQFELRASDGRAYAGAGHVVLDENGLDFNGYGWLTFNYNGLHKAYIFVSSATGNLAIVPASGYKLDTMEQAIECGDISPYDHEQSNCGYSTKAWKQVVSKAVYATDTLVIPVSA
ncbi:hypothetical protein ES707_11409 [subsurface metagenome]